MTASKLMSSDPETLSTPPLVSFGSPLPTSMSRPSLVVIVSCSDSLKPSSLLALSKSSSTKSTAPPTDGSTSSGRPNAPRSACGMSCRVRAGRSRPGRRAVLAVSSTKSALPTERSKPSTRCSRSATLRLIAGSVVLNSAKLPFTSASTACSSCNASLRCE